MAGDAERNRTISCRRCCRASTPQSANPPWNQPHVIPLAFSRSPTFLPDIVTVLSMPATQSSSAGRRRRSGSGHNLLGRVPARDRLLAPCVWPEIRLSAPGVDGPNPVA